MKKIKNIVIFSLIIIFIASCEDPVPKDYQPEIFVEAVLVAGEPIKDIKVMLSQPLTDSFDYSKSIIRDANIVISRDDENYLLTYDEATLSYFYEDKSLLIQPETKYDLEITFPGRTDVITGTTTVPKAFSWVNGTYDVTYYPQDTLIPPIIDSLELSWEKSPGVLAYFIRIKCLDTLEYGKYLDPPTDKLNERIWRPYEERSRNYADVTRWGGPILNQYTAFVWTALKWYGVNEVSIYAPDQNFFNWFIQLQRSSSYYDLLGSVEGGLGCFGSATVVRDTSFIVRP